MFLQITLGEIIDQASLQWHSRLARRTYMSVSTKKCEGREFEPPLEQAVFLLAKVHPSIYQQFTIIIYMH